MSFHNRSVLEKLPQANRNTDAIAKLVEYNSDPTAEIAVWEFFSNPQSLKFSGQTKYDDAGTFNARIQDQTFGSSSGLTLDISDLMLETYRYGRTFKPLLEGIEELRKPDITKGIFAPKVLSFIFGEFRFSPCVISGNINWNETAWLNGLAARATLSFSLLQLPTPGKLGLSEIAPELVPQRFTDRQLEDSSKAAKEYLEANIQNYSETVVGYIRANTYKLTTDRASGVIQMTDPQGKTIGTIGIYDGKTINDKENNIPKKS